MPAPRSGNCRDATVACADGDGTTLRISGLRGNPSASSICSEQYSPSRRKPPVHENTRSQRRARDLNPCALARSPFSRRAPSANSVSPPCLRPRTRSVHGALLRFRSEALPRTSRPVGTSCCAVPARGIEHSHEGATSVAHATTYPTNRTGRNQLRDCKRFQEPPISGSALELVVELREAPRSEGDLNPRYR